MINEGRLQMDGIRAQLKAARAQFKQIQEEMPEKMKFIEDSARSDIETIRQDREAAVEQFKNVQQQMQQMLMMLEQKKSQIPQLQQQAQKQVMQAGQELQMAELRFNQISAALNNQDKSAVIVRRSRLKSIADKSEKGISAYGKMDANESKAYRACCVNGAPSSAVGGLVDRLFCAQGRAKEASRQNGGI